MSKEIYIGNHRKHIFLLNNLLTRYVGFLYSLSSNTYNNTILSSLI